MCDVGNWIFFNILGIFWDIIWKLFGFFGIFFKFFGNFCGGFFWRIFLAEFFGQIFMENCIGGFFGRIFWEDSFGGFFWRIFGSKNYSNIEGIDCLSRIWFLLEIVGEWVMNRQPFWIKIVHISPILLGRFCDKKVRKLLSVLCSLWGIFGRENLQCVFSMQTLQCAMFLFSYKLA